MQATRTPGKKPKQASRNLTQEIEGCIRRRGLTGGLRGLGPLFLQGLDVLLQLLDLALTLYHLTLELSDLLMLALEVVLHGWWSEFPCKLGKG